MMRLILSSLLLVVFIHGEELPESLDHTTVLAKHGEVFSIMLNASLLSGAADTRELCLATVRIDEVIVAMCSPVVLMSHD